MGSLFEGVNLPGPVFGRPITGRAWSFITNNIPGDHFVLKKAEDVPAFLEEVQHELGNKGKIKSTIQDIEGCFPNMSKSIIQVGLLTKYN